MMHSGRYFYDGMFLGHGLFDSVWFWLIAVGLVVAVIAIVYLAVRGKKAPELDTNDAIEILNTKFAKGEITLEEYNMRKEIINEGKY